MGIDRDFPMTRRQATVLVVGLVVLAGFGAALFGGLIPGLTPNYAAPNILILNGERYYFTTVFLSVGILQNSSSPQSIPFENVTFDLWVSQWTSFQGGLVHGNGTEPNGTVYSFVLGSSLHPPVNTSLYISPDHAFAIYWPGGPFAGFWVRLMVRA